MERETLIRTFCEVLGAPVKVAEEWADLFIAERDALATARRWTEAETVRWERREVSALIGHTP
jgi:hypothetical protein